MNVAHDNVFNTICNHQNLCNCELTKQTKTEEDDSNQNQLEDMKKYPEREKKYLCDICTRKFTFQSNVEKHKRKTHEIGAGFKCPQCPWLFNFKKQIHSHIQTEHLGISIADRMKKAIKIHECKICGEKFTFNYKLKEHTQVVHKGRRFLCPICNLKLVRKSNLRQHIKNHEKNSSSKKVIKHEKSFRCNICHHSLSTSAALNKHKYLMHLKGKLEDWEKYPEKEKNYLCDICTRKFTFQSRVDKHKRITHDIGAGFKCPQCPWVFPYKKQIPQHIRTEHSEREKRYSCDICTRKFKFQIFVKKHKRKTHEIGAGFKCPQCPYVFPFKKQIPQHIRREHLEDLSISEGYGTLKKEIQIEGK